MQRVNKDENQLREERELNEMIQCAFRGDFHGTDKILTKYREVALEFVGGPIAVTGCDVCKKLDQALPCYHCGRFPWMKTRKDITRARKDLKQMPTYIKTGLLHAACLGGNIPLCNKLIAFEAAVNAQDEMGCTPLHWLACSGHKTHRAEQYLRIAELLLTHGVDVTIQDHANKTPAELTYAPCPPFNNMRMMILKHAKPMLNGNLLQSCQDGDLELMMRMIQAGGDLMTGDWLNDTPMHVAVTFGHYELVNSLIDIARGEGRLLQAINQENVEGHTCIDVALKWGYKTMAQKLKQTLVEQQVKEMVGQIARGGGGKVPPELKGTLLGKQIERELKEQSKLQKRMVKALRLEQVAQKREKKMKGFKGDENHEAEGGKGSKVCVIS
eukprot:CAMPEP_0181289474 /NCGR_PEP_ID=MMETSP1101-20121128/900_1 /TAXON_ID=46948 /ORGANISM="Rhodomonas abbreviata, Strain Caron Lab Isolate" /LENGTH=384 /DNA_ID=CAMNT_0023393695 /DNA_START=101 /DNA_END=1255 /DNA_ORIENTATION=-